MTAPYSGSTQGNWYQQFDPNVHYYYDEQGLLHYFDPNTNLDCDYQPQYDPTPVQQQDAYYHPNTTAQQQQQQQQHQQLQSYTPSAVTATAQQHYAEMTPSRQGTPDVLLPCPEPTCNGENKPKSKFCEECGIPLGAISRSATPNVASMTRAFSQQQIHDSNTTSTTTTTTTNNTTTYSSNYYSPQIQQQQQQQQSEYPKPPVLQRPPTAPVYSINNHTLDSNQTVPLYHPSSFNGSDPRQSSQLYYNGVQHQSMHDLYGQTQQLQQQQLQQPDYHHQYQQVQQQQPTVDPLGRARGCPIVTFGFGGKMLVTFPRTVTNYYQSTVKPQPGPIKIKHLKDLVRPSTVQFPGPLLFDSKVGTKQKKKDVVAYIVTKVDEFEKLKATYLVNSVEAHQLQSKILLWQLMKAMIETDGHINDKDKMDNAILQVLRPPVNTVEEESHFSLPAYNNNSNNMQSSADDEDLSDQILSKIEQFLMNGDRKGAVEYAIQEDLWAHALIISSCVDKELWQKVITNFVDREMNATPEMRKSRQFHNIAGNNQALRVMYSLFSGAGGVAMNQFLLSDVQHINTPYGLQTVTPPAQPSQLIKWRDTLAILLANRTPRDTEALAAFGDIMKEQGWIDAAHICYLLSPLNSMHSGVDTIQVRMTLVGGDKPTLEAYELSEIFEFAHSLHNGGTCLPFLQGYKLAHAMILSDYGLIDVADRYHDAIDQSIKLFTKGSPYLHPQLNNQVAALNAYLENATGKKNGVDPASWLKPKFQKKALTSLWGSLEGSFTKFVSGEEVIAQEPTPPRKSTEIMSRPF